MGPDSTGTFKEAITLYKKYKRNIKLDVEEFINLVTIF